MKSICFATNNANKLAEIRQLLEGRYQILSLSDIGCHEELPETQDTLAGNAQQKAQYVWEHYHISCFADDTGLLVDALNGEPGVYSARYAGPQRNSEDNMQLVLEKMGDTAHRSARFVTVICLVLEGTPHLFEGVAEGEIIRERSGTEGFGYDPIFRPEGNLQTFAEMSMEEKNTMSHRGKATRQLVAFLNAEG